MSSILKTEGVQIEPNYFLKKGFSVSFLYGICTVDWNKP